MSFEPWMLAAMEDEGYMDTSHGLNMRVAKYLAKNGSDEIDTEEFRAACISCGVDPVNLFQKQLPYDKKFSHFFAEKEPKTSYTYFRPDFTQINLRIEKNVQKEKNLMLKTNKNRNLIRDIEQKYIYIKGQTRKDLENPENKFEA